MKICIVGLFCILVLANCIPDEKTKRSQYPEECNKELGVTEVLPNSPANKEEPKSVCMDACLLRKEGAIVDGKAVVDKMIALVLGHLPQGTIDPVKIKEKTTECVDEANKIDGECKMFAALDKCILDKLLA